jgi:hypothetical protein
METFSDSGRFSSMTSCLLISRFFLKSPSLYHHPVIVHADVKVDEKIFPRSCFLLIFVFPCVNKIQRYPSQSSFPISASTTYASPALEVLTTSMFTEIDAPAEYPPSPRLLLSVY